MSDKNKAVIRILFGVIMVLGGAVVALFSYGVTTPIGIIGNGIGISLIVTGFVSIFQEAVVAPLRKDELQTSFNRITALLKGPGIHMLAPQRRGYSGYHKWLLETSSQELFFAGHSVLHRVQADFENRGLLSVEQAIRRKISEGSQIRILFLDPTWDFIDQIAASQEQEPKDLRKDLATTLGIVKKLSVLLDKQKLPGKIEVRTYRELTQYAFHYTNCREKNEVEMLMGYYFAGSLGTTSPLFVVDNEQTQGYFIAHFNRIFERQSTHRVLRYSREGSTEFNQAYYRDCQESLCKYIDANMVAELCP